MPRPTLAFAALVVAAIAIGLTAKFYFADSRAPGAAFAQSGGPAMLAGAPAQSYDVTDLTGKPDSLAHYRGKVVLLNLWASWCAPCRSETPALERLYRQDRDRGFVVVGVDQGESASAAQKFAREMDLTYPILVDENQQYGNTYAAVGLPTSLVITRDGHIARGIDGELSLAEMHAAIDPLLRAAIGDRSARVRLRRVCVRDRSHARTIRRAGVGGISHLAIHGRAHTRRRRRHRVRS